MSYQTDPRKIFCASDLHIGYEKSDTNAIYKFLDIVSKKADELILCGDVFDMWRYPMSEMDKNTKSDVMKISEYINNIAKNIPTTIVWGNHDYQLGKNIDKYRNIFDNIRITDEFFYGDIYFCHGWRFDYQQVLGSTFYGFLINEFPYIYQKFFRTPSDIKERKSISPVVITDNDKLVMSLALKFVEKENLKYLIMGHTHTPTIFNNKIINCGDFIYHDTYVIINGKDIDICYL